MSRWGTALHAVDGGDGKATLVIDEANAQVLEQLALRTKSRPDVDPMTGAELGAGLQAASSAPAAGANDNMRM